MKNKILLINGTAVLAEEFLRDNAHDEELVNAVNSLTPGQSHEFGGGAAPIVTVMTPYAVHHSLTIFMFHNPATGYYNLKIYRGNRLRKPYMFYRFKTESSRCEFLNKEVQHENSRNKQKLNKKEERINIQVDLKVGDILHYSWGYEQTNCDFFQVVDTTPKGVKIREISSRPIENPNRTPLSMSEEVEAIPNCFLADAKILTKRMKTNNSVQMEYGTASLWDGKPKYSSWYA